MGVGGVVVRIVSCAVGSVYVCIYKYLDSISPPPPSATDRQTTPQSNQFAATLNRWMAKRGREMLKVTSACCVCVCVASDS